MSVKKYQLELARKNKELCDKIFIEGECTEEDWIHLQTFCAIAIELTKDAAKSVVKEAARKVEIRHLIKRKINHAS